MVARIRNRGSAAKKKVQLPGLRAPGGDKSIELSNRDLGHCSVVPGGDVPMDRRRALGTCRPDWRPQLFVVEIADYKNPRPLSPVRARLPRRMAGQQAGQKNVDQYVRAWQSLYRFDSISASTRRLKLKSRTRTDSFRTG